MQKPIKPLKDPRAQAALDAMSAIEPTTARAMFGGYGYYSEGGPMYALFAVDQVYFKVDDLNRSEFEDVGGGPFVWMGGDQPMMMQYYSVPESVWVNSAELTKWMKSGQGAADRAAAKKKPRKR